MAIDNLLADQVMQALVRGDKLAAVKLMRDAGAGSLREAMQRVAAQAASREPAAQDEVQKLAQGIAGARDRHGVQAHARAAQSALRAHARTPTVVMGEAPGEVRWLLLVLGLLALAAWLAFAGT